MKSTSKIISILLIMTLICFYAIPVLAEDTTSTDQTTTETTPGDEPATDKTPTVTDKDNQLAASISNRFNTPVTGQNIRDSRMSGMGYGSITIAYGMAAASGKSISDITAMRQQGLGWGDIAHQLGIKVSDLLNKSSKALKSAKLDKEAKALKSQAKQESDMNKNSNKSDKSDKGKSSSGKSSNSSNSSSDGGSKGSGNSGGNGGGNGSGNGSGGKH